MTRIQLSQTKVQLENTRKQVDVGNLPELSAAQIESQYATDSSNLITAETNTKQMLLQMKALLQLNADVDFDIAPVLLI